MAHLTYAKALKELWKNKINEILLYMRAKIFLRRHEKDHPLQGQEISKIFCKQNNKKVT